MNIFYLLLLAHLIGDFPLQSDSIFRLKQKSMLGVLLHVAVFALVALILFSPFLAYFQIWLAVLVLLIVHAALDRLKLTIASSSASDRFRYFILDQAFHFFSLWIVSIWLSSELQNLPLPAIYRNSRLLLTLNALILAGFAGSILLFYGEKIALQAKHSGETPTFPKQRQRWPGILIRMLATGGAIMGGWHAFSLLLVPLLVYLHPTWYNNHKPLFGLETSGNLAVCVACAAWVWLAG
jgi:hypothetical protein